MISVIIPSYNREHAIEQAIHSVLNQTYSDFELIVVDDGSTDQTAKIVKNIRDTRVKYVFQENAGVCAARNKGVDIACGDYIAFFDSDDICRPNRLEKQLAAVRGENLDLVCGRYCIHKQNGSKQIGPDIDAGSIDNYDRLFGLGAGVFFAKAEVFKAERFDSSFPGWEDLELLLRIVGKYSIGLIDDVVIDYFIQGDTINYNPKRILNAFDLILQRYPDIPNNGKKLYENMLIERIKCKYLLGNEDVTVDYKSRFLARKTPKALTWYLLALLKMDKRIMMRNSDYVCNR